MKETIKADPSKNFFIEMLTRDISAKDCVLDLLDNSIDSVFKKYDIDTKTFFENGYINHDVHYFKDIRIDITLGINQFIIKDNCFGIDKKIAKDYAFRFGSDKTHLDSKSGLSVYGIGMKRAFFKIGNQINLESRTSMDAYSVNIDVEKWSEIEKWDFSLENLEMNDSKTGTVIIINELHESIGRKFSDALYISDLKKKISVAYSIFINSGLSISINGKILESRFPEIRNSDAVQISRKDLNYMIGDKSVDVLILCGIGDRVSKGWYVFCNGRLVLEGNTDSKTGWGGVDKFPAFHNKFNSFSGIIFFSSKEVDALPWTTTKEDVELDSDLYQKVINEAKSLARPYLTLLNNAYPERNGEQYLDIIPERKIVEDVKAIKIQQIPKKNHTFEFIPIKKKPDDRIQINFKVSREDYNKVAEYLGDIKIAKAHLGEKIFKYFIEMEDL